MPESSSFVRRAAWAVSHPRIRTCACRDPKARGSRGCAGWLHEGGFMSTLRPSAPSESLFEDHHADPWGKSFVDLPSLNARVSDTIAGAIQNVRTTARDEGAELRSKSVLV